ncbi:MAG TPA: DUF72 domain-containing protein [Actinomycetota bacterium]|nr:DUF72 domain-containing protein [Actinomycetota bacterium]
MTLFVGTSGWAYKEWKPDFYPADVRQKEWLRFYSSTLGACEINATFYRLQSPETMARWGAETSAAFRFSLKMHRRITHSRSIAPDEAGRDLLKAFFEHAAKLDDKLGVVLLQFPPHRARDDAALGALIDALPSDRRYAFEFRNDTWDDDEVRRAIADAGGTVCLSNTDGKAPAELPPGDIAYIRLRTDEYEPDQRDAWKELLLAEGERRDVFAFAKHEGIPAGNPFGGVGLAKWLAEVAAGSA